MIDPKADTKQILAKFNKPQFKKKKKERKRPFHETIITVYSFTNFVLKSF